MLLNLVNNYKNFVFHKGKPIKAKEKAYIDDPEKPGETWTSIEESKLVSNYQTPTVKLPSSKKSLPGGSKKKSTSIRRLRIRNIVKIKIRKCEKHSSYNFLVFVNSYAFKNDNTVEFINANLHYDQHFALFLFFLN